MIDLGPQVDAVEVRQYEDDYWLVAFDEDFSVEIEHDGDGQKLFLLSELGALASDEELSTCKLLLNLASMWRETGGLRIGLSPVDEKLIQIFEIPVAGLTVEDLAVSILNFADSARHARSLLESGPTSVDEKSGPETMFLRA